MGQRFPWFVVESNDLDKFGGKTFMVSDNDGNVMSDFCQSSFPEAESLAYFVVELSLRGDPNMILQDVELYEEWAIETGKKIKNQDLMETEEMEEFICQICHENFLESDNFYSQFQDCGQIAIVEGRSIFEIKEILSKQAKEFSKEQVADFASEVAWIIAGRPKPQNKS